MSGRFILFVFGENERKIHPRIMTNLTILRKKYNECKTDEICLHKKYEKSMFHFINVYHYNMDINLDVNDTYNLLCFMNAYIEPFEYYFKEKNNWLFQNVKKWVKTDLEKILQLFVKLEDTHGCERVKKLVNDYSLDNIEVQNI